MVDARRLLGLVLVATVAAALAKPSRLLPLGQHPGFDECVNILQPDKVYKHHPVMLRVGLQSAPLEHGYLLEWNGLKIPVAYDCNNFRPSTEFPRLAHNYFYEVPTRWSACYQHEAALKAKLSRVAPVLPFVDDEYHEQVAVYQSVLRAHTEQEFIVAELGARWGTWGSRAVAFHKTLRPGAPYKLHFVELNEVSCGAIRKVCQKNKLEYTLACEAATAEGLRGWLDSVSHVDVMDVDIQGAEMEVIPKAYTSLSNKVYRLIIGTHSPRTHQHLEDLFVKNGWIMMHTVPHQHNTTCIREFLRGFYKKAHDIPKAEEILRYGCVHQTPRGPVAHFDGELVMDNPRFVDASKRMRMTDSELVIDDLKPLPTAT